jgi:hypothetical protein
MVDGVALKVAHTAFEELDLPSLGDTHVAQEILTSMRTLGFAGLSMSLETLRNVLPVEFSSTFTGFGAVGHGI